MPGRVIIRKPCIDVLWRNRYKGNMTPKKAKIGVAEARSDWLALVKRTLDEVSQWAAAQKWAVVKHEKQIEEQGLGLYSVPVLTIQLPSGRLHVEPIARYVHGAEGRIDLLYVELLNRLALLRKGKTWVIRTDSGVDYPASWNQGTFVEIAQALGRPT